MLSLRPHYDLVRRYGACLGFVKTGGSLAESLIPVKDVKDNDNVIDSDNDNYDNNDNDDADYNDCQEAPKFEDSHILELFQFYQISWMCTIHNGFYVFLIWKSIKSSP